MTPRTKNGFRATAIIVSWVVLVVGFLYWASTDRANVISSVNGNTLRLEDHETRLRGRANVIASVNVHTLRLEDHETRLRGMEKLMATDIAEIKTNIDWLRLDAERDD